MSFHAKVCERLPLADATLHMLDFVADPDFLADLFDRHRGRSYERQIAFADLVHLLADSLMLNGQSAHRTFQQARADGELSASVKAAYDKIARLPIELSAALLTEGTARLRNLLPASLAEPVPVSLAAFTPLAFDGKKIKEVAHRLRPLRVVRGQVIGGKILVAENVRTGLAVAMEADPDGEASDLKLVPGLLARTRAVVSGPRLWIGDRLFCDLQLGLLSADGDHFVVRYCAKTKFHPDLEKPAKTGVNSRGQAYTEEWGWLGGPTDKRRLYVRRVTVHRPGDEDVSVVTDLVDGVTYPAADILDMYLRRWGIERLFQKVTEVFHLQALVSAREKGTVFQAALCLLLYNLTVVVRAYVAEGAQRQTDEVSMEKLFVDMCRQLTGLVEVLGTPAVVEYYADGKWTAERLRKYLDDVLGSVWRDWWKKSPPREPSKPVATEYLKGGHSSVYKIVRGLHETIPETKPPANAQRRPSKQ
jgi:Transposase DDE domain